MLFDSTTTNALEELRLATLRRYRILDTEPEEQFDRITRLLSALVDVPIAAVTLVDRDRQWFKSKFGLEISETPRSASICAVTMMHNEPLVIEDVAADERFRNNPLVKGEPGIRFYVGFPIVSPEGMPLGALCGIDRRPRKINEKDLRLIRDLAQLTSEQLQLRSVAMVDGLTGAMRRSPFLEAANQDFVAAKRLGKPLSCMMIDADHFKKINDSFGHVIGDQVLVEVAQACRNALRSSAYLGRLGGEEFCAILPEFTPKKALSLAETVRAQIEAVRVACGNAEVCVTVSIGVATMLAQDHSVQELIQRADKALYTAKRSGRNRSADAGIDFQIVA